MENIPNSLRIGAIYTPNMANDCAMDIYCPKRGIAINATMLVCQYLQINCTFIWASDRLDYGRFRNNSWTGLIGDILNGTVDISIPLFYPSYARHRVVDFSSPYFYFDYVFITRMPTDLSTWNFGMLFAFNLSIWASIVFACILISFSINFMEKEIISRYHYQKSDGLNIVIVFMNIFQYLSGRVHVRRFYTKNKSKLLFNLWALISIVFTDIYTGLIFKQRVAARSKLPFKDFSSLIDCIESDRCEFILTQHDDHLLDRLILSNSSESKRLQKTLDSNPILKVFDTKESLDYILNKKEKYWSTIGSKLIFDSYSDFNRDCKYYLVAAPFSDLGTIAMRKGSTYRHQLDLASRLFRDNGLDIELNQWYRDECENQESNNTTEISLISMQSIFVFYVIGNFVSILVFGVEKLRGYFEERTHRCPKI